MKMRHLLWFLPLLLCCNKKNTAPGPVATTPFKFTTQYDSVITTYPTDSFIFFFSINVASGDIDTDQVTYSISGLPTGITVFPASVSVTRLLGGNFTFYTDSAAIRTDTVNLIMTNKDNGAQTHQLFIKVVPFPDNAPLLAGTYDSSFDYCNPADSLSHFIATVATVPGTPYEIKITNLKNLGNGFVVDGWVSNIIRIPVQTIGSRTIWGTGNYTKDNLYEMTINDTLVNGADTERCILHLQYF